MANCVTNDECGSKHFYSVEEPEEINRLIKRSEGWDETFAPPPPEFQDPDPPKTLLEKFAKQLVTVLINESFNQAIENRSTCYEELSSAKQNNSCEILKKNLLSESQIYPEQKIKDNIYEKHYKSSIKQDNSTKIKKLSCHIVCCTQNIDPCFPELQENNPEIKVESHHCTFPENVPSTSELNLTKQENSTETPYSGLQLCSTPAYCTPDPGNISPINQENISKISQNHNWTPEYTELENTSEILKNRQLYTSPENNPCWTPDGQKEQLSINHYSEPWNPEKQENSCEILTNWTSDQETTCEASKNPSQHEKSGSCWTSLAHKSSIAQEKTPDQSINHYSEPWNPDLSPKKQTQNSLDSSSNPKNGTCWTGYKCTIDQEITKTPETSLKNSKRRDSIPRWTPELPFSPGHHRPGSRGSLASSRLSISHNSLNIPCCKADDSSFITLAMSHDVLIGELTASEISDIYNVPFDSDIYAVPIDMLHPVQPATKTKPKRKYQRKKKRSGETVDRPSITLSKQRQKQLSNDSLDKRYSVPAQRKAGPSNGEPIHMTLQEVRQYLQNLYSSSSDSSERTIIKPTTPSNGVTTNNMVSMPTLSTTTITTTTKRPIIKNNFIIKNKKTSKDDNEKLGKCNSFSTSIKQTLCSLFRIKKMTSPSPTDKSAVHQVIEEPPSSQGMPPCLGNGCSPPSDCARPPFSRRALPPLPASSSPGLTDQIPLLENGCGEETVEDEPVVVEELSMDFAASIEKVKDYGWYWGPISGETAEKILSTEPDGSFIVRDSSDHHYIFSLTFRLNGCVRHVRIEHDQGNFSFGSCTKFKSHTIVDFIENAVEHSRSGRYLFFLHRRPVLGPMRVQLLHPVSRFKQVQSLQHMCRFVILKLVRRDLIGTLPLPRRVLDYLSTPHYYAEQQLEDMSAGSSSAGSHSDLLSFVPHRPLS